MLENLKKKHAENQATEMAEAEKRIDATKLDGDDNLDIDDIWSVEFIFEIIIAKN